MKRTFRLTALIMALLMLVNISALATTEGISVYEFEFDNYVRIFQSAVDAAQNQNVDTADVDDETDVHHWAYVKGNNAELYNAALYDAGEGLNKIDDIPAASWVKAYKLVSGALYLVEYKGNKGYVYGSTIATCKCNVETLTDTAIHLTSCNYRSYIDQFAIYNTADQIYGRWDSFSSGEQAYLLDYLKENNTEKYKDLVSKLPQTKTETVGGTTVSVTGNIPADVSLSLEPVDPATVLPEFSQLGENLQYVALDVKLKQGNTVWQPGEKVQVTISAEKLGENGETVALFHKHGDNATELLGAYQIKENKLTFEMSGFSYLLGVNVRNIAGWIDDLADMTIQQRYDFLTSQPMTDFWLFMELYVLGYSDTNLVCTCGFSNTNMQIFAPGAENHKSGCPWAFGNLSIQEQLLILFPNETEWLETATEDMIRRALRASSMESVLLENADLSNDLTQNAELYYVRSGKAIAYYQYEAANKRGVIIEPSCDLVIAYVNVETGAVTPVAEALANN